VLIVAGSDSGGGAGIQADTKTVTALDGYAMTAITGLTAQDTREVLARHDVPADFVAAQMRAALTDIGADCVKTGMLGAAAVVEAVADTLVAYGEGIPLVVDPVIQASDGTALLDAEGVDLLRRRLIPMAHVFTPNFPEASALTGKDAVQDPDGIMGALAAMGAKAVLLKGGHGTGDNVTDYLLMDDKVVKFDAPRIDTPHTHGTGCTLASAIAVGLAQGLALRDAIFRARAYVQEAIRTAPGFGHGRGPLNHAHTVKAFGQD